MKPHPDLVDEDSPALERCQEDWAAVKKSTRRVKPPDSGTDETKNRPNLMSAGRDQQIEAAVKELLKKK